MRDILKLLIIVIITVLSSCSLFLSKMYGVKQLNGFNKEEYNKFISKLKDEYDFNSIISNTKQYKQIINLGRTNKEKKDLGQPVQIIYYKNDSLKSFHANCYAKGNLSNLEWNTDDRFSLFIPESAVLIDSFDISLNQYIRVYPNIVNQNKKKYTILIFWTLMLTKISQSAIETVFSNIKQHGKEKVTNVILINTDNYFSTIE